MIQPFAHIPDQDPVQIEGPDICVLAVGPLGLQLQPGGVHQALDRGGLRREGAGALKGALGGGEHIVRVAVQRPVVRHPEGDLDGLPAAAQPLIVALPQRLCRLRVLLDGLGG